MNNDRVPVIIGIGEIKDQPADPAEGLEPAVLAASALRAAEADAGAAVLSRLDSLSVVNVVSWPYVDLPGLLAERLGIRPARLHHGPVGGHTPVRFLHEAAARIARGESEIAAVCGAESSHTATLARRHGITLPWTPPPGGRTQADGAWLPARDRSYLHPLAHRYGLTEPITIYPLYENATAAAWGQTPAGAAGESAALWSGLSRVAAANPGAWMRKALSPGEVATVSPENRMIAWPYPKRMVANPAVNQGAAVLLTSLALARSAGIPTDRLIRVGAGAAAAEPHDWCSREGFDRAAGQAAVLDAMLAAIDGRALAAIELYSCFPVVPKMARRRLGLPPDAPISAAGGLTFHGAPLNNYMTHGTAALVRTLRERGGLGLLYGQGGTFTSHHALLIGEQAVPDAVLQPADRSAEANRFQGPAPPMVDDASGPATLETFTIVYDRDGAPGPGTVVLRLPGGARTLARVSPEDAATRTVLEDGTRSPIGVSGSIGSGRDGLLHWSA